MHQIQIEVEGIYFKCLDKGIYSAEKLLEIRNSRCGMCGECECAQPRIVFPKVIENEKWLIKYDGSRD